MSRYNLIYFAFCDYRIYVRTRQGEKSPLTEPAINSYVKLGKTNKPKSKDYKIRLNLK